MNGKHERIVDPFSDSVAFVGLDVRKEAKRLKQQQIRCVAVNAATTKNLKETQWRKKLAQCDAGT